MEMNSSHFSDLMKDLAEITGKQMTDRTIKTYWNSLFKVDATRLRDAFKVFAAKGKWATINDWLQECGYRPQEARSDYTTEGPQQPLIDVPNKRPEDESGEMTWMFEAETESETQAGIVFAAKERHLEANGWTIRGTTSNKARTRPEGKTPSKTVYVRFWDCIREQPCKTSRRFKSPQEGMAAIRELLGPAMATKLIPHAEAYEQPHRGVQTESVESWDF